MLRSAVEEALYWSISIFINLILFTLLTTVFIIKVKEVPEFYPINLEIKRIQVKEQKPPKSVKAVKAVSKKTVAKRGVPKKGKNSVGAGVSKNFAKGDVGVPKEEDVSLLAELQKKISEKLKKEKKKPAKKRVGTLSAVITGKEVRIKGGSRHIVFVPPPPELITREFPSKVRVRIWVDEEGNVVKALLLQRSGSANIDSALLSYVREIKFEKVEGSEVQIGEIAFSFLGG